MWRHWHLLTGLVLLTVGTTGLLTIGSRSADQSGMMGMQGGMKAMMQGMMSDRLPPGIEPEKLPDPTSRGAKLMRHYCIQCHAIPSPALHTAEEWPRVFGRMLARIRMMSHMEGMMMGNVRAPSHDEETTLLQYLQNHALRQADSGDILRSGLPGAETFTKTCTQCHALPDPGQLKPNEWPSVVARMKQHQQDMDKRVMSQKEQADITALLQRLARQSASH